MAERPALPDSTGRKLAVLWDTLRDKLKLTEEDLANYDRERQRLLKTRVNPMSSVHPLHFHAVAHHVGLDPSVRVAERRFRGTDSEYWWHWCSSGEPYETYAAWLETVKRETVAELESIWKGRSAASDKWFEVVCKPAIEKALSALIKGRIAQARDVEVTRLDRKTRAEAWARAADSLPGVNPNRAAEQKPGEPAGDDAGPAVNVAGNGGADRRAATNSADLRQGFVQPILTAKGWSILDWANNSTVDFHTANNYLKGTTNPYASTRKKLADSLGVAVTDLPA